MDASILTLIEKICLVLVGAFTATFSNLIIERWRLKKEWNRKEKEELRELKKLVGYLIEWLREPICIMGDKKFLNDKLSSIDDLIGTCFQYPELIQKVQDFTSIANRIVYALDTDYKPKKLKALQSSIEELKIKGMETIKSCNEVLKKL